MMLHLLGKPLESEEEKQRYIEDLEKELKRKEKLQEKKDREQEEKSLHAENVLVRQEKNRNYLKEKEEEEKARLLGKQHNAQNKVLQMKEKKEEVRSIKLAEHSLSKQEIKIYQHKKLISYIETDVINTILNNFWKCIEEHRRQSFDSRKLIGLRNEQHDLDIITYISRSVQTELTWRSIVEFNVGVGSESKPYNSKIRKRFIESEEVDSIYYDLNKNYPITDILLQEKLNENKKIQPDVSSNPSSRRTSNVEINDSSITRKTPRKILVKTKRTAARVNRNNRQITEIQQTPTHPNGTPSESELDPDTFLGESKILPPKSTSPYVNTAEILISKKKQVPPETPIEDIVPHKKVEQKNNIKTATTTTTNKISQLHKKEEVNPPKLLIEKVKHQAESLRTPTQVNQIDSGKIKVRESLMSFINSPQSKSRRTIDEEEDRIAQQIQKIIELRQEEEIRKKEQLLNKQKKAETPSSSDDEFESLFDKIEESPEEMAGKMRKRLLNNQRFFILIHYLRKKEEFKNLIMQRADLDKIQDCDTMLDCFFGDNRNPDFKRATLAQPKFTPIVNLNPDFLHHQEDEEFFDNVPKSPRKLFRPNTEVSHFQKEIHAMGTKKIWARNVSDIYLTQEENLETLLKKSDKKFDKMINKLKNNPIEGYERFTWLKEKLVLIEKIMLERQKEFEKLYTMHNETNSPRRSLARALPEKAWRRSSAEPEVKRKYKVDFDILSRREHMSKFEIMERRYKMFSEKDQQIFYQVQSIRNNIKSKKISTTTLIAVMISYYLIHNKINVLSYFF